MLGFPHHLGLDHVVALHHAVLATATRWEAMGSRFRGRHAQLETSDILTISGLAILAVIGLQLLSRYATRNEPRVCNSSRKLFRALCREHGLDWSTRRLLMQLARWHRLTQPAELFVDPARFDPVNLSPALVGRADELSVLRAALFATEGAGAGTGASDARSQAGD